MNEPICTGCRSDSVMEVTAEMVGKLVCFDCGHVFEPAEYPDIQQVLDSDFTGKDEYTGPEEGGDR